MGRHDIGDYFKDRLKDKSLDIDTGAVWNELGLEESKRRRGLWWIWSSGIIAILTIGYFSYTGIESKESTQQLIDLETITTQKTAQQINETKTLNINDIHSNGNYNSTTVNQVIKPTESSNEITKNKKDFLIKPNKSEELPRIEKYNSIQNHQLQSHNNHKDQPYSLTAKDINKEKQSKIGTTTTESPIAKNIQKELLQENSSFPRIELLNNIQDVSFLNYNSLLSRQFKEPKISKLESTSVVETHTKPRFNLDFYTSAFLINRNLTPLNLNIQEHLDIRNSSERGLESIAFGVNFSVELGKGFSLGLGLEQQQINEVFNFSTSSIDTIPVANASFPTLEVTKRTETIKHFNTHKLFNLPLHFGYQVNLNKWELGMTGSVLITFNNSFSGRHFDPAGTIVENPAIYNDDLKFSYRLSVNLSRRINNRWSLHLDPTYQIQQSSIVNDNIGYEQKYKFIGLSGGLSFRL